MACKELALLAVVVLVLYGRSGVLKSRQVQTILPWISPSGDRPRRRAPTTTPTSFRPQTAETAAPAGRRERARPFFLQGNRLFWFLTILAATAVAAVILGRIMIASGMAPAHAR